MERSEMFEKGKSNILLFCLIFSLFVFAEKIFGQADINYFGQNKVQYKNFSWKIYKTKHFDIYFYQGEDSLVIRAGKIAEEACSLLSRNLRHTLTKRFPIILYNSHNDFAQTNVILELIEQSVGGFTETFKNRVVLPFDGGNEQFRHVLHHELVHAFEFDIIYASPIENLISRGYFFQMPLWFAEGLAEFESMEWDSEADMFLRDATIQGRLVPIQDVDLYGDYRVYKEGQSFLKFIAERYGRQKPGEILVQLKITRDINKAVQSATGSSLEKLNEEWIKSLKKTYWPLIAQKKEISDVGKQLTDHAKEGSYLNINPAISPDGTQFVFLSDKGQFTDVYLASALDGKILKVLVKGERSGRFESFPTFRSGFSWSPDGERIVFVAKSETRDRLYIVEAKTNRIVKSYSFDMDALFSPSWSPDGKKIAFNGLKDGLSDIYTIEVSTGKLNRLTNDFYDDKNPVWSNKGEFLAFTSDRPLEDKINSEKHFQYAIYIMKPDGSEMRRVTRASRIVSSPSWSPDDSKIIFSSDINGISNLFVVRLEDTLSNSSSSFDIQLTDIMGGVFSPSWSRDGKRLLFSGFGKGGWDIFVMREPGKKIEEEEKKLVKTYEKDTLVNIAERVKTDSSIVKLEVDTTKLSDSTDMKKMDKDTITGKIEKAGISLSADWLSGAVGYSSLSGLSGQAQIALSDILGNHRIYILTDLVSSSLDNSNINFTYFYLPKRIDWGMALFQEKYYYLKTSGEIFSLKSSGGGILARYPFNRFQRIDLELDGISFRRQDYDVDGNVVSTQDSVLVLPSLFLVHDTALWGLTGPVNGSRSKIGIQRTLNLTKNSFSFVTGFIDTRRYLRFARRYVFAHRIIGGGSWGSDAQLFAIGGSGSLRGYPDYAFLGTKMALLNLELRYPLIDRLDFGVIPISIGRIRGVLFLDMGATWYDIKKFKFGSYENGAHLEDVKAGFGVGVRARIAFLVIRFDVAKRTDFSSMSKETPVYFSLGSEF